MKDIDKMDTKERILYIAHKLFADKGIHGVSIRELAKAADVNVSAINYYFSNKEALYAETIKESISQTTSDINELYFENITTDELSKRIYQYFIDNSDDLRTCFKLFLLSDNDTEPFDKCPDDNSIGPPGALVIYQCIHQEVSEALPEDIIWAVRTIFTQVLHKALLMSTNCTQTMQDKYGANHDSMNNDISRLVRVILTEIGSSN